MFRLLPALAFLSGMSGIAYEVLYARIFGAYLGDMFYVSAILLATFFVGIAAGSFWSYRHVTKLPYLEMIIGASAMCIALLFRYGGLSVTAFVVGLPFGETYNIAVTVFALLIVPATAIGFSIPLFVRYIEKYASARNSFDTTYLLYNIGAALAALAVEFLVIRYMGLSAGLLLAGSLNIFIGVSLFLIPAPRKDAVHYRQLIFENKNVLLVLGAVSVASGVIQAEMLSLFELTIGPLNGTFSLVVATMLLGVGLSVYVARWLSSFKNVIAVATLLPVLLFSSLHFFIVGYAYLWSLVETTYLSFFLLHALLLLVIALPIYAVFGATVPALVSETRTRNSGLFLGTAALCNALGYLLLVFVLHEHMRPFSIFFLSSVFILGAFLFFTRRSYRFAAAILFVLVLVFLVGHKYWPSYIGSISHWDITDLDVVTSPDKGIVTQREYKKYNSTVAFVKTADNALELLHHGNRGVSIYFESKAALRETLIGVLGAFYSTQRREALVIGLAAGITASGAADVFERVHVAEIHPPMLDVAKDFSKQNGDLFDKKNVSIEIQDGLIALVSEDRTYDVVVSTVSSPRYYAAHKLWTRDFYHTVRSRLRPGGVFVGWVDAILSKKAFEVVNDTLATSFHECIYHRVNVYYYAVVCGDGELNHHDVLDLKEGLFVDLLREHGWRSTPYDLIQNITFKPDRGDGQLIVNTIDKPLLEHNTFTLEKDEYETQAAVGGFASTWHMDPFTRTPRDREAFCEAANFLAPYEYLCVE